MNRSVCRGDPRHLIEIPCAGFIVRIFPTMPQTLHRHNSDAPSRWIKPKEHPHRATGRSSMATALEADEEAELLVEVTAAASATEITMPITPPGRQIDTA